TVGGSATSSVGLNLAAVSGTGPFKVVPLTTYQALSTSMNGNASTDNVFVTGSTAIGTTDTVNAVLLQGNGITISGTGSTLTVNSGTIAATNGGTTSGNTISAGTLALGSAEGKILTNDSAGTTTISSTVTGTGGLTIAGAGQLALTGSNNSYSAANSVQ